MRDAGGLAGCGDLGGVVRMAAACMIALVPSVVAGQLSPGALSRAHESLDTPLSCTKCHGGRSESTTTRCLACHREIASLQQQKRGYHARDGRGECASCHPDHAGRDFALIQWPGGSPSRFDHAAAGWALEGKHRDATCASCHKAAYRVDPAAKLSPRAAGPRWVGLTTTCTGCHVDPHRESLGQKCESCHDLNAWKPAPGFDHEKTRYPLTGRHAEVSCAGCHLAERLAPKSDAAGKPVPVFKPVPAGDCVSCHADPHKGRLTGRCSSCHVTSSFRTIARGSFSHDQTRYPLVGGHRNVPCASCHAGYPRTVSRPSFATCASCHADPHAGRATLGGRAVDCAACHRVESFAPSTFTAAAHQRTAFPLLDAHARASCASCHRTRVEAGRRVVADLRPATRCEGCHLDPHVGKYASVGNCETCHDQRAFRPARIDVAFHSRLGFPLEGAHRTVPCSGCHRDIGGAPLRRGAATLNGARTLHDTSRLTFPAPTTCAGCHRDPHGNQFAARAGGGACESCHDVAAFQPASRFDHDRDTRFRLAPAHTRVPCASCHVKPPGARSAPVVYRGTEVRCSQCHAEVRR